MNDRIVVADAGPLRYLGELQQVSVLPHLFHQVLAPRAVALELSASSSPAECRAMLEAPPGWLEVVEDVPEPAQLRGVSLHRGERAAIALALARHIDLLLCDDREARSIAQHQHIRTLGTLGIIAEAALQGLLDFEATIDQLTARTNFRHTEALIDQVRARYARSRSARSGE